MRMINQDSECKYWQSRGDPMYFTFWRCLLIIVWGSNSYYSVNMNPFMVCRGTVNWSCFWANVAIKQWMWWAIKVNPVYSGGNGQQTSPFLFSVLCMWSKDIHVTLWKCSKARSLSNFTQRPSASAYTPSPPQFCFGHGRLSVEATGGYISFTTRNLNSWISLG